MAAVGIGVTALGFGVAHHAYAGHGGVNGTYCQQVLAQNNALLKVVNDPTASTTAVQQADAQAPVQMRAIDRTGVEPGVLTAADALTAALDQQAAARTVAAAQAAGTAYNKAVGQIAEACNAATGQNVTVRGTSAN